MTALDPVPSSEPSAIGITPPGYRMPAGIRLGAVRLQVADLTRSLAYYTQQLGLRVVEHSSDAQPRAVLAASDDATPLVELRERRGATPVPRRGRLGLFHFAILLPDRPSLGRFVHHLARVGVHAGMSDHLVSEAVYLSDPDGLGIEVYADRPRSRWGQRGRELAMATEPLDVASLLAESGDESWSGMPAGTRMGHVHLHVGDLARAEEFYHGALGLDKIVWSYPGALFLSAGGYHHHLGVNTWAAGAPAAADQDARLLEWEVRLPRQHDALAAVASLSGAGHSVIGDDGSWLVADPWGTRLRIVAAEAATI